MDAASASGLTSGDFADRRKDLLRALGRYEAATVAVFGYGSALGMGTQSHGAMRYLSGWDSHEAISLFVFNRQQTLLLLSSPFVRELAQTSCPDFEVIAIPPAEWAATISDRFGIDQNIATVGFDEMPSLIHAQFMAELQSVPLLDMDAVLAKQRLSKSQKEISSMEAGAKVCDALFASLGDHLCQERPVWQTQLQLETAARLAGAEYCKTWLTVRPQADYPRYWPKDTTRCPRLGDQVLFGIALTVDGYFAHGIRMGSIGPVQPEHLRLWQIVHNALSVGQETLTNGTSLTKVDAEMSAALSIDKQAMKCSGTERFRNGHGLGMSYEEPLATHDFQQLWHGGSFAMAHQNSLKIPVNSVFELHPNLFIPQVGGAALGEMFHVTEHSAQPFLQFPLEVFELTAF